MPWQPLFRSLVYVSLAIAFGGWIWIAFGQESGLQFYSGYMLEMSLSMDNVFVISLIFGALSIPPAARSRVLFWGLLGAAILRGVFIFSGVAIVSEFRWVLILFGIFLIFTGIRMTFVPEEKEVDIEKNRTLRLLRRWFTITPNLAGDRFFVRGAITPLLVALVMVEVADLIFAFDSVPAVLAVTTDPLIVYTSNMFAILCLRSLYFVLEAAVAKFDRLGAAIALILVIVGAKVIAQELFGFEVPVLNMLMAIAFLLAGGVLTSWQRANEKI